MTNKLLSIRLFLLMTTFCLILSIQVLKAEKQYQEKRIYLVDVTKSMVGGGSIKTDNILSEVKIQLLNTIDSITDKQTEICIISFTNKPLEYFKAQTNNKDSIKNFINSLSTKIGDTNILEAWDKGLEEIDSTKTTYIFLITDGLHNFGPTNEDLYRRLSNWSSISKDKKTHAYYLMLAKNNKIEEFINVLKDIDNLSIIDNLNIRLSFKDHIEEIKYSKKNSLSNISDNQNLLPKTKENIFSIGLSLLMKNIYWIIGICLFITIVIIYLRKSSIQYSINYPISNINKTEGSNKRAPSGYSRGLSWEGEKGNSNLCFDDNHIPGNKNDNCNKHTWKDIKAIYKFKNITFKNGSPDFSSICAVINNIKCYVTIDDFTTARYTRDRKDGGIGNFEQADIKLAEKLGDSWTEQSVREWRNRNYYTWHEIEGGRMELVPKLVHDYIPHEGGISHAKKNS